MPTVSASATLLPSATPQPSVTSIPASATPTFVPTPLPITLYNRYMGKDSQRQPDLVRTPPGVILSASAAAGYERSYVARFLGGKQVNGDEIRGDPEMLAHLILLFDAAYYEKQAAVTVLSSYRSFADQQYLAETNGGESDRFLAPPGRSEHQLGTAVDLAWNAERLNFYLMNVYPQAREFYNWLKEHAHQYGFIFSYPFKSTPDQAKTNVLEPYVTEYKAEPWHLRYVGAELAAQIDGARDSLGRGYLDPLSDLTPQQFFLPPAK